MKVKQDDEHPKLDLLRTVFEDGVLHNRIDFATIRENAKL